jgi:hypothetical protein
MPLAVLNRVVFQPDGTVPDNARINFVFLNNTSLFTQYLLRQIFFAVSE